MISHGAVITNAASNGAVWSERPHFCNSPPSRARAPRPRPFVPFAAVALRPRIAARRCERSAACFLRRIIACLSPPRTRGRGPAALDRRAREAVCKNLQNLLTEVSAMRILLTMHSSPLNDIYSEGISQHTSYMIYVARTIVLSKLFIFAQAQRCKSHIEPGLALD